MPERYRFRTGRHVKLLWIALGGAVGTLARYALGTWAAATFGAAFPVGTAMVNVLGSFLISVIATVGLGSDLLSPTARAVLMTGVMGGFTTYSSFNYETLTLAQGSGVGLALLNVGITVAACLAAGLAGMATGRWLIAA